MNGDNYSITRAKGGFIVYINRQADQSSDTMRDEPSQCMVFADSAALINFLHNELAGSN